MQFTEVQRTRIRNNGTMFALHLAGCSDLAREVRDSDAHLNTFEAPDVESATHIVIDGELDALGYTIKSDLTVYGCCRGQGPLKSQKPLDPSICAGTGQPFSDDRTPQHLYRHCPVCGALLGARRGVAPRHKKPA
jgi:hypothetical protein